MSRTSCIPDVPFIGSRMYGNAIGTKKLCINSGFNNIGIIAAAAVAQRGDFIDIYTQFRHDG